MQTGERSYDQEDTSGLPGLPKTGDVPPECWREWGYKTVLVDGSNSLTEEVPLTGNQHKGKLAAAAEIPMSDFRKYILFTVTIVITETSCAVLDGK